jgi:hypothetical protein
MAKNVTKPALKKGPKAGGKKSKLNTSNAKPVR